MGDVLGTQEVSIWNKEEDKAVDVSKTTNNANNLNVLPTGVASDFYPLNVKTETPHEVGDIAPLKVDTAGNLMCRSAVLTDENSFYEPFAGSTLSDEWTSATGTGQTISVANSYCTLTSGTTSDQQVYIIRSIDYSPLIFISAFSISQRIANQTTYMGFISDDGNTFARFVFSGTDNTKVICSTQSSTDTNGSQGTSTQLLIPYGLVTSSILTYKIRFTGKVVEYYVGADEAAMVRIAVHTLQMPDQYTVMNGRIRILNGTSPASSTTVNIDTIKVFNFNIVDVDGTITGDVNISQKIVASGSNNSTTNLASGATFTGVGEESLNFSAIQFVFKADQNFTIYVDQSSDLTNWDITDSYDYKYSLGGASRTVQSVAKYFRVRATNVGTATTTYLRLSSYLLPTVEALPRSTDAEGHLSVCVKSFEDFSTGWRGKISPMGEQRTSEHVKLCGEDFEGTTLDTNFWTATNTGTGSSSLSGGELVVATGATSNSTALLRSVRAARYVGSCPNYYRSVVLLPAVTGTNTRRWGAYTTADGFFFEHNGTDLKVVTRIGSADTAVTSGSFNGEEGSTFVPGTSVNTYEIIWTNSSAWFYVNGFMIHKVSASTAPVSGTLTLNVSQECNNSGGNTNNNQLKVRSATISRIGKYEHSPIYKNLTGAATTVCKYGAGTLHRICNNAGAGTMTIYDNTAASGTKIAVIAFTNNLDHEYHCPFFTGLTIVTTGTSQDSTAVYE